MQSLLEFERDFQSQIRRIENIPWTELKLRLWRSLWDSVVQRFEPAGQLAYRLQLCWSLIDILTDREARKYDNDPELQEFALQRIEEMLTGEGEYPVQQLWKVRDKLIRSIAVMYLRLGALERLEHLFTTRSMISHGALPNTEGIQHSLDGNIHQLEDYLSKLNPHIPQKFRIEVAEVFPDTFSAVTENGIYGLFVASESSISVGIYAKIMLESMLVSKKQSIDQVRIASHLVDEHDSLAEQATDLCQFLHQSTENGSDNGRFRIEYSIDQPTSLIRGNSLGLVLGVLAGANLRNRPWQSDIQYQIFADVAYSGVLGATGQVQPVNDDDLCYKIRTAFFGPFRTVVLPADNRQSATKALTNLKEQFPGRDLRIKFIQHIEDVFRDPELVLPQRRSVGVKVKQFIRRKNKALIISGLLAFIALLLSGYWFIFMEDEPAYYTAQEDHLVIRNQYGVPLWETPSFGKPINPRGDFKNVRIQDINGDEFNEVILGFPRDADFGGYIYVFNHQGEVVWKFKAHKPVHFGENLYSQFYSVGEVHIHDVDYDGDMEIIAISGHRFFPHRIIALDHQGNFISDYWHSGNIANIEFGEIYPGNNTQELMFAAVNNEYDSGIVGILDPLRMEGSSPQHDDYYSMKESVAGNEIYYLRFPPTHFQSKKQRDTCAKLNYENEIISVGLFSGESHYKYGRLTAGVIYHINNDLRAQFVDIYDMYYDLYTKVYPEKEPLPYNNEDILNHFRQIKYWNGSAWADSSTVNTRYLETLNSEENSAEERHDK